MEVWGGGAVEHLVGKKQDVSHLHEHSSGVYSCREGVEGLLWNDPGALAGPPGDEVEIPRS